MCLQQLAQDCSTGSRKKKKKAQPSDHKHVLSNGGCSSTACHPPSSSPSGPPSFSLFQHIPLSTSFLPHPLNFNTCLSSFLLSFLFLYLPPPSADLCFVSSNYQSTEKTLSFKGLAIISVEHNKMTSPQEEGEV